MAKQAQKWFLTINNPKDHGTINNPKNTVTSLDDLPLFLTVEQAAAVLGIGRNTTYDMVRSGRIESIRLGRQIRIPKSALNSI